MRRTTGMTALALASWTAAAAFAGGGDGYLQSDGSNYINTHYYPTPTTRIEVEFEFTDTTYSAKTATTAQFSPCVLGSDGLRYQVYINSGGKIGLSGFDSKTNADGVGKNANANRSAKIGERYVAVIDRHQNVLSLTADGAEVYRATATAALTTARATKPLWVFCSSSYTQYFAQMKLYRLKISEAGALVHDYVPARRDGVAGLWDTVDGIFFSSATSTPLTAGGDDVKEIADEAYVQSDGTNGLLTDYFPKKNTSMYIDYELVGANDANSRIFDGGGGTSRSRAIHYLNGKAASEFAFYICNPQTVKSGQIGNWTSTGVLADNVRHTFRYDLPAMQVTFASDGVEGYAKTIDAPSDGGVGVNAMRLLYGFNYDCTSVAKLYRCMIYEDGALVRDYRPYTQDGLVGLKDAVNGGFISTINTNALRTAQLTPGGSLETAVSPYVESDGLHYVDTGYFPKTNTCLVTDFAYVETNNVPAPCIYGASGLEYTLYVNGNKNFGWSAQDTTDNYINGVGKNTDTKIPVDVGIRHTFGADQYRDRAWLVTGSLTNYSATITKQMTNRTESTKSLTIFTWGNNPMGYISKMKFYGMAISEEGSLVRKYVPYVRDDLPGVYDEKSGQFLPLVGGTYGGDVSYDRCHAYLASDGAASIDTGYKPTPDTRIELDFAALATNTASIAQPRFFGSDGLEYEFYCNGARCYGFTARDTVAGDATSAIGYSTHSRIPVDPGVRHTFILDKHRNAVALLTDGETTYTNDLTTAAFTRTEATQSLLVFAGSARTAAYSQMMLYSLRIYEKGQIVREYLPYKSGDVCGLYETQKGTLHTGAGGGAFTVGGMGVSGEESVWAVPPTDAEATARRPAVLTAFAPGAVAYRWFGEDGAAIDGATGATLTVPYETGVKSRTYRVIPVFTVAGRTVEGEAQTASVAFLDRHTLILVR